MVRQGGFTFIEIESRNFYLDFKQVNPIGLSIDKLHGFPGLSLNARKVVFLVSYGSGTVST